MVSLPPLGQGAPMLNNPLSEKILSDVQPELSWDSLGLFPLVLSLVATRKEADPHFIPTFSQVVLESNKVSLELPFPQVEHSQLPPVLSSEL